MCFSAMVIVHPGFQSPRGLADVDYGAALHEGIKHNALTCHTRQIKGQLVAPMPPHPNLLETDLQQSFHISPGFLTA